MPSRLLVIDTATPDLSVALFDDGRLMAAVHERVGRGHAERLLPAIAGLPDGGRADAIWVGCGPGSFTGIRIAIAAAKALAFAWDIPLRGFDTLALVAADARQRGMIADNEPLGVALDGGHGDWFVCENGAVPRSLSPAAAAAGIVAHFVAGSKAGDLVALRGAGTALTANADCRAALGMPSSAFSANVSPSYGRAPDAALAR